MSVAISDGDVLAPIYTEKGGFLKPAFYGNFDIDGHKSIFSELVPEKRAVRAKAVLPLFSARSLKEGSKGFYSCANLWVERMREASREKGKKVNILELTRGFAVDGLSEYLFGKRFGGLDDLKMSEKGDRGVMRASGMVDMFVGANRYWYLPTWAFEWIAWADDKLNPSLEGVVSMDHVDSFVAGVVAEAEDQKQGTYLTYQGRMLDAGISVSETRAQCKDLIFAGTDSTGMNLATICFMLAKNPDTYKKLKKEVQEAKPTEEEVQSLPYLRGVVTEGLRLAMANPARSTRVVPPEGWTFKETYFPPGTDVSCAQFELHYNGEVFGDAREFRPERWAEASEDMRRDYVPFGTGARQCIARNLATKELFFAVQRIAEEDVLKGARCCQDKIEIMEWFNSKVVGERIDLVWD